MAAFVKVSGGGNWKKALKPYATADKEGVKVGILEGSTYPDGSPVATVAAAHEFGTEHVPARSFMRSTLAEKKEEWVQNVVTALKTRPRDFRAAFAVAGHQAVASITDAIESGLGDPLKENTVKAKARRGKDRPELQLVDTGTMEEALGYEVNETNQQVFPNKKGGA